MSGQRKTGKTDIIIKGMFDGREIYLKDFIQSDTSPTIVWSEDRNMAKRFTGTKAAKEFIKEAPVHRETELIRVPDIRG